MMDALTVSSIVVQGQLHELTHPGIDILEILKGSRDELGTADCHWVIDKANESLGGAPRALITVLMEANALCAPWPRKWLRR